MDFSQTDFYQAFMLAWTQGLFWCGGIGFVGFELMKLRTKRGRDEMLKAMPWPIYLVVALLFGAIIAVVSALTTLATESNFLNAIFYGFLLPSSASRWLGLEKDTMLHAEFSSDDTTIAHGRKARPTIATRFQLALFGVRV